MKKTIMILSIISLTSIAVAQVGDDLVDLGLKNVKMNPNIAKDYFRQSCNLKNSTGCFLYASYVDGKEEIRVLKKTIEYYTPSPINKFSLAESYVALGKAYLKLNNSKQGCKDLKKACDLGLCNAYKTMCKKPNKTYSIKNQDLLNLACTVGNLEDVKKLLKKADVNGVSSNGWRPIITASKNNHLDIVKYLLNHGAKIDLKNAVGYTALHKASYSGHSQVVRYLLSKGAKVNLKSDGGKTPLLVSIDFYFNGLLKNTDTISILLKNGADPTIKDKSDLNVFDLINIGLNQNHPKAMSLFKLFKKLGYK